MLLECGAQNLQVMSDHQKTVAEALAGSRSCSLLWTCLLLLFRRAAKFLFHIVVAACTILTALVSGAVLPLYVDASAILVGLIRLRAPRPSKFVKPQWHR